MKGGGTQEQRVPFFMLKKFKKSTDSIEEIKTVMLEKFDDYDRKIGQLSRSAKICIGISLGLSLADTIILIKILQKIK